MWLIFFLLFCDLQVRISPEFYALKKVYTGNLNCSSNFFLNHTKTKKSICLKVDKKMAFNFFSLSFDSESYFTFEFVNWQLGPMTAPKHAQCILLHLEAVIYLTEISSFAYHLLIRWDCPADSVSDPNR